MSKKIAVVVQRYGDEVNGGAEVHAKMLAEKLSLKYIVEILTTTSRDYVDWDNYYPVGHEVLNGITVRRFPVMHVSKRKYRRSRRAIFGQKKHRFLKAIGLFSFLEDKFQISRPTRLDVKRWLIAQGPYCPQILKYIKDNRDTYDVFIFFTYLYYPTALGMQLVGSKSIFIPTAHDEDILYTRAYEDIFSIPSFIMYNTVAEKKLVERIFKTRQANTDIAGVGIDLISDFADIKKVRSQFGIEGDFFVYIGRIDPVKGCTELLSFFQRYIQDRKDVTLVLVGKNFMKITSTDRIITTGFVDDHIKNALLKESIGLIVPSEYESLSLVALEAMSEGKTVIVNGKCEVLKNHIDHANSGFYYTDYASFRTCLDQTILLSVNDQEEIGSRAQSYVKEHYSWPIILEKFDKAITLICRNFFL